MRKESHSTQKKGEEIAQKESVSCTFIPHEGYLVLQQEKGRNW